MRTREFHDDEELDYVKRQLADGYLHPLYADISTDASTGEEFGPIPNRPQAIEDKVAVWNSREDRLAYIGGRDTYDLVQHSEVVEAIEEAIDMTTGSIDFGMIRDYGEQIHGTIVFGNQDEARIDMQELLGDSYIPPDERPDTDEYAHDSNWRDAIGLGMRFQNSFDGEQMLGGTTMGYRYICRNWMVWDQADISTTERAHVRKADAEHGVSPDFFVDIINDVFEMKDEIEPMLEQAEETEIPFNWVPDILADAGFGTNYAKRITGRVLDFENPSEDETTQWRLYNAATEELDHNTVIDSSLANYNQYQGRAWNVMSDEPEQPDEPMERDELEEFAIMQ